MAQRHFAGIAMLVASTFTLLALAACANSEQVADAAGPILIAPAEPAPGTPEFHGAVIGDDSLRGPLQSD